MADKNILLLFDRPSEPMFAPKGSNNTKFVVPNNYLKDEYKNLDTGVVNRFGIQSDQEVQVKEVAVPPLGDIAELGRDEDFSNFIPKHQNLAEKLINIFMNMQNPDALMSFAVYARDRVNPVLFNYALSVALLHRSDTQHLDIPSLVNYFPGKYFQGKVFATTRENAYIYHTHERRPIEIDLDFTASNLENEHRVAYFREDIGLNLHHWHWHLVYPYKGLRSIVGKDRRGELFYYMHQQCIARYNCERLCNNMQRVERFSDLTAPIPEGYFPKLDGSVANRNYPSRVANMRWQTLNRSKEQLFIDLDSMRRWRDRIFEAIHSGFARDPKGKQIPLTEIEGIDILGNMIESSIISVNREYYGDFHNMGHNLTAFIHDPDHRHLENFGVMGDPTTAMRDPFFYRWHAYIDDIFQTFKNTLPRYTEEQLNFAGVTVEKLEVEGPKNTRNKFQTFWQKSDIDISAGIDFVARGTLPIRFTHLQHAPFQYKITVNNNSRKNKTGTCRIFMAPKLDERDESWLFVHQKNLFIELDKFTVQLPPGPLTIYRSSSESSVTIPFERTFRSFDDRPSNETELGNFNMCGCGWPENLLIPKGNENFRAELFVMISDYEEDKVVQDTKGRCNNAGSYCGIKDRLYPDRRSMGYPFDRLPRDNVNTLQEFLTTNMRVQEVIIQFSNVTVEPKKNNKENP